MSIETLREICARLNLSATALCALGAVLNARVSGVALDPKLEPHLEATLGALGASEALRGVTLEELRPLVGELRTFTLTNTKLLFGTSSGWRHAEPELLQAAGDVSAGFPRAFRNNILPKLDGLTERLASDAPSFLDVGVGVASLSIEMARLFPSLRVVGIDSWAPALALAFENVKNAGLAARIELREQSAEELADIHSFDLAWIPGLFVPEPGLRLVVQRVARALKPGAWLLFATLKPSADHLTAALTALRTAQFGGSVTTPERVEALLRAEDFDDVRILPSSPSSLTAMIAARRSS